jgi:hypothetical protein
MIATVKQKSNGYFSTRYWALKKVTIISLLVTGPHEKAPTCSLIFSDKTNR